MRLFLKFSLILTIILIAASVILPPAYRWTFPRSPGPTLDRQMRTNHLKYIEENQPRIVLIGDSTLVLGIDASALAEETGKPAYSIGIPGSASALWYLLIKNNIADASFKPDHVVVVFRDTILTAPGYRVHGSYFALLDEYAKRNEPVLIEKSFVNLMNPLELMAEKYSPLYVSRSELRKEIDTGIRYFAPALFGCDKNCTDYALGELFEGADMEPGALVEAVGAAESLLYTSEQLDFESQVDRSLLPDMIEIAKTNDINLVFVRIKVKSGVENSPELDRYLVSLQAYLKERSVPLLDFGNDPRLTDDLFRDSIHFNKKGMELFTQIVAEGLMEISAER
ncbi:MAG: hypothetical protein C4557_02050 [Anaerolineaceae bacterium]|jgi:hypothetical protein|nr:MAG: hypothetical protein C4557_02050 [Anaerolineaceae bacterium]